MLNYLLIFWCLSSLGRVQSAPLTTLVTHDLFLIALQFCFMCSSSPSFYHSCVLDPMAVHVGKKYLNKNAVYLIFQGSNSQNKPPPKASILCFCQGYISSPIRIEKSYIPTMIASNCSKYYSPFHHLEVNKQCVLYQKETHGSENFQFFLAKLLLELDSS